ncbi:MAG: ECF-type sigma factor [Polyangiales bacterium]
MGESTEAFFERVYEELQRLAKKYQSDGLAERTSLVHEAFLKMRRQPEYNDAQHFYAVAATAMRQVLVDRARSEAAIKRGGGMKRVSLTGLGEGAENDVVDVLALDEVLSALWEDNPRQAQIVELRFFGGLSTSQIAEALEVSESTVEKDWKSARETLSSQLRRSMIHS